ncbi:hypothetical protein SUNI508_05661 [Seiridium unicorne]|uniref:DUF6604 domain-containing protein n=1 Tax=Seiridium unicorne TaxID=138068 RepID=A0ABR2V3K8_9PEZI
MLSSTYRRYKSGHRHFVTWLLREARKQGIAVGSDMKRPDGELLLRCYLEIVEKLKQDPDWRVGRDQIVILANVIGLRAEQRRWNSDKDQNDGHQYPIVVLRRVQSTLEERCDPPYQQQDFRSTPLNKEKLSEISNIFEHLKLASTPSRCSSSAEKVSSTMSSVPLEKDTENDLLKPESAEEEIESEKTLAWSCFFNDFDDIRKAIRAIWKRYVDRDITLIHASLLTNLAFDQIRQFCQRQLALAPTTTGLEEADVCTWVYHNLNGPHPSDIESHNLALAEWCCADIVSALSVWKALRPENPGPRHTRNFGWIRPENEQSLGKHIRVSVANVIGALHGFAKFEKQNGGILPPPDILTRFNLQSSILDDFPLWTILGIRVSLDIQNQVRGHSNLPLQDLQASVQIFQARYAEHLQGIGDHPMDSTTHSLDLQALMDGSLCFTTRLYQILEPFADGFVLKDAKLPLLLPMPERMVQLTSHKMLESLPTLCGMLAYRIHYHLAFSSISLDNAYEVLVPALHLYNGLALENAMPKWEDMDFILAHQGIKRFYKISDPPRQVRDVLQRFSIAYGNSILNIIKTANPRQVSQNLGLEDIKNRHVRMHLAHDILGNLKPPFDINIKTLQGMSDYLLRRRGKSAPALDIQTKVKSVDSIDITDVLHIFDQVLEEDELHFHFDFAALTFRCVDLFTNIRESYRVKEEQEKERATYDVPSNGRPLDYAESLDRVLIPPNHFGSFLNTTRRIFASDPRTPDESRYWSIPGQVRRQYREDLRTIGVTLKEVSEAVSPLLEKEGSIELRKARSVVQQLLGQGDDDNNDNDDEEREEEEGGGTE